MLELTLGIAAAFAASTLYSAGVALQAMDAKQAPHEEHLRLALVSGLLRRARYLLGTAISVLGWPLQVVALLLAPLVIVQPALAAGLLVLLAFSERALGEPAGHGEQLATLAILLGVAGAGLCAPPLSHHHSVSRLTITLVLVGLAVASALPYLLRPLGRSFANLTMVCGGLAFGWGALATKLAADDLHNHHLLVAALWGLSTAAASGVGMLSETSALQKRPAIQVAPVAFVTQAVVPVACAPLLFGERFTDTPLSGAPLAMSLAVLLTGATMLARSPLLTNLVEFRAPLMAGQPASHDSS